VAARYSFPTIRWTPEFHPRMMRLEGRSQLGLRSPSNATLAVVECLVSCKMVTGEVRKLILLRAIMRMQLPVFEDSSWQVLDSASRLMVWGKRRPPPNSRETGFSETGPLPKVRRSFCGPSGIGHLPPAPRHVACWRKHPGERAACVVCRGSGRSPRRIQ
jgi:hypothetical protein